MLNEALKSPDGARDRGSGKSKTGNSLTQRRKGAEKKISQRITAGTPAIIH